MAGIGFELRKIYSKQTLASNITGTVYATMTTIGPTVLYMALLFGLKMAMEYFCATEIEDKFFVSSFTYEFLIAILVSAALNTVLSRYISDKIFEEREDEIAASIFGSLTIASIISGIGLLILCYLMYVESGVPIYFLIVYYFLGILATNTYLLMTYVSALKEYKEITISFLAGIISGVISFLVINYFFNFNIVFTIYLSLAIGYLIINILMIFWCVKAFGTHNNDIFAFMGYFFKYPKLIITGSTYMFGFYVSNIIYWAFSDIQEKISIFRTTPNYDMAMFLAIIVNLPAFVIFVVKVETNFFDTYVQYLSALNKGTYTIIEKNRVNMQNTLKLQLFFVYDTQLIITVLMICIANLVFPYFGINMDVLNFFLILAMGMFCVLCMHFTIIFLYYFEDYTHACITSSVFLIIETVGAFICVNLDKAFYPLPLLLAGITAWLMGYIFLRSVVNKLNAYLLCR